MWDDTMFHLKYFIVLQKEHLTKKSTKIICVSIRKLAIGI